LIFEDLRRCRVVGQMTKQKPTVVIGAGHNGLVAAAYLARAGRSVLVLEASAQVGGAAATHEFFKGFRVSSVSHLTSLLDPVVHKELSLARHGLVFAKTHVKSVALAVDQEALVFEGAQLLAGTLSELDRAAFAPFVKRLQRFASVLGQQHGRVPPRLQWDRLIDAWPAARFGLDVRRLGREDMREFLRVITMAIQDVLDEEFSSDQLKGALAIDAVLGTKLGPRSGNTVFSYLHRYSGQGRLGVALPQGGMGAISQSLSAAAREAGAEIRLNSKVTSLEVSAGAVAAVLLENGERVEVSTVLSSLDPKTTLLTLLGARHLDTELAQRVHHYRSIGTAAKVHIALSGLPQFKGVQPAHVGERLLICPSATYADEAFNAAKYQRYSEQPVMELSVPTVYDATLAPPGQHVLSAIVQYAPYDLKGGWEQARAPFEALVMQVLERYAPGIGKLVLATELLTPVDLERQFGMTGGHWHHGELSMDQALMLRPVHGIAQYQMPVQGLFLCGAGAHPGGGVMGSAGRNAADVVLKGQS
jgi:phytoene dehydrogenase-like protein